MNWNTFLSGDDFHAHHYFGVHYENNQTVFRVYAPKASRVTLEGDFNGWQEWDAAYRDHGAWIFHVPYTRPGQNYKYVTYSRRGKRTEHADPYGYGMGDYGCSVIRDIDSYEFRDWEWMQNRSVNFDRPLSIYELHLGSWLRNRTYETVADELIDHLRYHHYTHVEFMPLNEHPMDGSWGYQATGFFSPTNRFGEAWQLMNLIDRLHRAGFGAILDFVCVHFAVDRYGLRMFDGSALYESTQTVNRRSDWGSLSFEHTKGEVRSFLKSCANYWLSVYHFDGLRVDAVSHLIYSHGDQKQGDNPGGQDFLRGLNAGLEALHPTVMRIAEDSTAYPRTTAPALSGGLGFHYKWAMGWTYDALGYWFTAPENRPGIGWRLTGTMGYFGENRLLLSISHDTVGNGRSLLSHLPGSAREKLRQGKLMHLYMTVHPGKKLRFLGSEGTPAQWNVYGSIDHSLFYDNSFAVFCRDINRLYLQHPALWQADYEPWSAQWVCCEESGIYAMVRHSADEHLLMVLNTSNEDKEHWFPLESISAANLLLHTQWTVYGGRTARKEDVLQVNCGWVGVKLSKASGILAQIWYHSI